MKTFLMAMRSGPPVATKYHPFDVTVGGVTHTLALHRESREAVWQISDPVSGCRITELKAQFKGVPCTSAGATLRDALAAAPLQISEQAARHGVARFNKTPCSGSSNMRIKNTIMVDGKRKVCRIWDFGGTVADRYTIAFKGYRIEGYGMVYPYLASGPAPFHPQGFGQHGESRVFMTGKHLGKRIAFEDLPPDVQKFVLQSI